MIAFDFKDVIDILLVAGLLFYLYKVMKQSSAGNIFQGILIFVIVWIVVSSLFKMRLLGAILDKMISIGALALVVLFQEELRRFFSNIGTRRSRFFSWTGLLHRQKTETGKERTMPIVMACMAMSKRRMGALIVMERRVPLGDFAQSGEMIDADINSALIENIFFKNSPLHDGAMIVGRGRIRAAGCILPVAHDTDIPKNLGLRHRAALGISQKSDALAVVVSEETGNISVAYDGRFHLGLTADTLETILADPDGSLRSNDK